MAVQELVAPPKETALVERPQIVVNEERCVGCQECVVRCPTGALTLRPDAWVVAADSSLCVGCRQCERTCPFTAIQVAGPVWTTPRERPPAEPHPDLSLAETRPGLRSWEEAKREAERCLACPDPTCVLGCPAHNDIPAFLTAVRAGDLTAARDILAKTSVFPDICSRVCDQQNQCEGACSLALAGAEPVAIGLLERFVTDRAGAPPLRRSEAARKLQVAVVGAGPAGMAAAWDLLAAGADVTLWEARSEGLGVLGWGIPDFTLPEEIARRPWSDLMDAGLKVRKGVTVGRDVALRDLLARNDAVVLAHGASVPLSLRVPGSDLPGVEDATSFLVRAKAALRSGRTLPDLAPGARLLVVGAGNTAMDVARSALRLGASPVAVDIVDRRFAKVRLDELEEAEREGVEVRFGWTVDRFEGDETGVHTAWLARTRQAHARARPRRVRGPLERLAVDRVVLAMGYRVAAEPVQGLPVHVPLPRPDLKGRVPPRRWLASGILARRNGGVGELAWEREVMLAAARRPLAARLWVVGDALTGPATVVAAMAQGRAAAQAILAGEAQDLPEPELARGDGRPARALSALFFTVLGLVLWATGRPVAYTALSFALSGLLLGLDALSGWIHTWVDEQTRRLGG